MTEAVGTYIEVLNYNTMFADTPSPVIVNHIPYITEEDKKNFNELFVTFYDTDVLSHIPRCTCGKLQTGRYLHETCPKCHTEVINPSEGTIEHKAWLQVPEGVAAYITPDIWVQLTMLLSPRGYNLMEWLTDSRSRILGATKPTTDAIKYLESRGWPRGLNFFVNNFDTFLEVLPDLVIPKRLQDCREFIGYCKHPLIRDTIFPQYLPMPDKVMIVLENNALGTWADKSTITGAIDAARTVASLSVPKARPWTISQLESKAVSVIRDLTEYSLSTSKKSLSIKKGWFRGHLWSSRSHFCFRGVITSITNPHFYEELHVPWSSGLEVFKYHLISKLFRRKYTFNQAYGLIESAGNQYHPLLDKLMQEIINENIAQSKTLFEDDALPGYAVLFQRNPSLDRLSGQLFGISKVKTDLSDKSISMSPLVVVGFNADYDGDEMNGYPIMGDDIMKAAEESRPHFGIHDLARPGRIRGVCALPHATIGNKANYVNHGRVELHKTLKQRQAEREAA